jgi:mannosyl-oligosaccharide alpha-1,2-mannosidase
LLRCLTIFSNGWGASAVDALSTAIIMKEKDIVNTILNHIATVDYTKTDSTVSLFETTIRYLGGMLAGYDLLNGPFSGLNTNTTAIEALLTQSVNLANTLKFAFDTETGIPRNNLDIEAQSSSDTSNGIATIGTLVLEWTRLSDLTNDTTYASLSQKGESYLLDPQPASSEPFPGLVGTNVDIASGNFTDASGGWVGGDDSFYEYLIKMYVYDSTRFSTYRDRWIAAANSSIEYLASHPSTQPNLTYLAEFSGTDLVLDSQHLACFDGGNFILGGLVLNDTRFIDFGLTLVDGCRNTYASDASGIGPESFSWDPNGIPDDQTDFFNEHGFYITNSVYDLRPEYIESVYYAYRATGDTKYQDWAWEAFVAINATTRTQSGFTYVEDVSQANGGAKGDNQESFLFAEVMKYSYLIHDTVCVFFPPSKLTTF